MYIEYVPLTVRQQLFQEWPALMYIFVVSHGQDRRVCRQQLPEYFDITSSSIESVVPIYLLDDNERARFDTYRRGRSQHD